MCRSFHGTGLSQDRELRLRLESRLWVLETPENEVEVEPKFVGNLLEARLFDQQ